MVIASRMIMRILIWMWTCRFEERYCCIVIKYHFSQLFTGMFQSSLDMLSAYFTELVTMELPSFHTQLVDFAEVFQALWLFVCWCLIPWINYLPLYTLFANLFWMGLVKWLSILLHIYIYCFYFHLSRRFYINLSVCIPIYHRRGITFLLLNAVQ